MKRTWGKKRRTLKELAVPACLFLLLFVFLIVGVQKVSVRADLEGNAVLYQAVQRAVAQCYAIEGMYPPDVAYLEEHYGVMVDHDKYIVHYEAFAANILPDIQVIDIATD